MSHMAYRPGGEVIPAEDSAGGTKFEVQRLRPAGTLFRYDSARLFRLASFACTQGVKVEDAPGTLEDAGLESAALMPAPAVRATLVVKLAELAAAEEPPRAEVGQTHRCAPYSAR